MPSATANTRGPVSTASSFELRTHPTCVAEPHRTSIANRPPHPPAVVGPYVAASGRVYGADRGVLPVPAPRGPVPIVRVLRVRDGADVPRTVRISVVATPDALVRRQRALEELR